MKARHIPTPLSVGCSGFALCGRMARWHQVAAKVRAIYKDPRNREGACRECVARYEAAERGVERDMGEEG